MADVKGITIQFKGETIELDRSIDKINNGLKAIKNESKSVNQALKFDPQNTDLLKRKLENLKSEQVLLTEKVKQYKSALSNLGDEDIGSKQWVTLNKQIEEAENKLQIVERSIDKVSKLPLTNLAKQFDEIGKTLDKIGSGVEKVGKELSKLSAVSVGGIVSGLKYNAELERQITLFTTLTGSAEEAQKILNDIKQDAKLTPFDTQSLISANQYLLSTSIDGDKARKTILALGDAISATGGGNSELQRMAQNLQQVQNVGKASSVDMKQFAMAGIDIWGILADYTGKTVEALQSKDFAITFDMISGALIKASQEGGKYYNAMSAQSETLNGQISILKTTINELLGELTQSLVPIVKNIISRITELVNKLRALTPQQKEQILKVMEIIAVAGPLLVIIGNLIKFIGEVSINIGWLIQKIIPLISTGGELTGVLELLKGAFDFLTGPIGIVIGLFILTYQKSETLREACKRLVDNLVGLLKPAWDLIISVIELAINVVKLVIQGFQELIDGIWKYSNFGTTMEGIFTGIVEAINFVINAVEKLIGWFQKAVDWANSLFSASSKASGTQQRLISSANSRRGGLQVQTIDSGGLGMASGGIGLTTNIHITNNGQPIDDNEVKRWVDVMANEINLALGRGI